jgi:hypothetical protein
MRLPRVTLARTPDRLRHVGGKDDLLGIGQRRNALEGFVPDAED